MISHRQVQNKAHAVKYKERIAKFLENMVEEPVQPIDFYSPKKDLDFKGPAFFRFNGIKTDNDIKRQIREVAMRLDTSPCLPQTVAWNMRPRDKARDIGPSFGLRAKIQMQRVHEEVSK